MEPAQNEKQRRRFNDSKMGIVVGVLVATVDGMEICDLSPNPISIDDFVFVKNRSFLFAESLADEGEEQLYSTARKLLKRQALFIEWMKSKE